MIKLNISNSEIDSSIDLVERIKNYTSGRGGRMPHNHINSIPIIMNYLGDNCKTYLEIGTYHGSSLVTAMEFGKNCKFFGVDFFGAGKNSEHIVNGKWSINANQAASDGLTYERVHANIYNANKNNYEFELIEGDSTNQETINQVKQKAINGIDLLFIDANHTFDYVLKDYHNYKNFINKGGFILFDDYGFLPEVKRAVDSINFEQDGFEIVERIELSSRNEYKHELIGEQRNATHMITKTK